MQIKGKVNIHILIDTKGLVNEFESSYRSLVKSYIEPTSITVKSLKFEKIRNHLTILFECNDILLSYFYPLNEEDNCVSKSNQYQIEIAQSLFEFWAHWLIKTFFIEELKVLNS
ncbi:hypothetical protein AAAC51_44905 [Priestia megaterium]